MEMEKRIEEILVKAGVQKNRKYINNYNFIPHKIKICINKTNGRFPKPKY